ncbi:acetylcholine receptor subunit alpha-type acr-16-like [Symsagittifera roscoffensis]|uniref:acetylcholine receptor subunit alpha-type acr-16-like n=1 Tax=Symsagittifera roscoffensis TaxID=84072 RepID=UPI00307B1478
MKYYGQNRRPLYQILSENLMSGYASIAKPTLNQSEQIDVHVAITLSQIVSVDVNLHQLVLLAWVYLSWRDDNLVWDVSQYKGIRFIRLAPTRIWVPDVGFINSIQNFEFIKEVSLIHARVNWMGVVSWTVPVLVRTKCDMDTSHFPFDTQQCTLVMASWTLRHVHTYHMQQVQGMLMASHSINDHPEWFLVTSSHSRKVFSPSPSLSFSSLHLHYTFQRRSKG